MMSAAKNQPVSGAHWCGLHYESEITGSYDLGFTDQSLLRPTLSPIFTVYHEQHLMISEQYHAWVQYMRSALPLTISYIKIDDIALLQSIKDFITYQYIYFYIQFIRE